MINRLINMDVHIAQPKTNTITIVKTGGEFTIQEYAIAFISGMSDTQRERFKKMLENNIECGMSVAKSYGIDYGKFIKEVKNQLGGI